MSDGGVGADCAQTAGSLAITASAAAAPRKYVLRMELLLGVGCRENAPAPARFHRPTEQRLRFTAPFPNCS